VRVAWRLAGGTPVLDFEKVDEEHLDVTSGDLCQRFAELSGARWGLARASGRHDRRGAGGGGARHA
jgi:hypothetical protein